MGLHFQGDVPFRDRARLEATGRRPVLPAVDAAAFEGGAGESDPLAHASDGQPRPPAHVVSERRPMTPEISDRQLP